MATVPRVTRDIRSKKTGVHFEVEGKRIQQAIKEKVEQDLEPQMAAILEKLSPILDNKKKVASWLCAFAKFRDIESLSAEAAEVYVMCRRLENLTDEVSALSRVGRNIFTDDWYVCDVTLLRRFGL